MADGGDGGDGGDSGGSFSQTYETITTPEEPPMVVSGTTQINVPELFGGEQKEGGIQGTLWVLMGEKTQTPPSQLTQLHSGSGIPVPGYRGVLTVLFDGKVTANNPYPKPWKFRVRRALKGWDRDVPNPELCIVHLNSAFTADGTVESRTTLGPPGSPADDASYLIDGVGTGDWSGKDGKIATWSALSSSWVYTIPEAGWVVFVKDVAENYQLADGIWSTQGSPDIHAMNPAHILYECATNKAWGRGLDPIFVDLDSFMDAAKALYDEGFGLCLRWNRQDDLGAFVQSVLDHVGGATYIDRVTGKLVFRLIRGDYNPLALEVYDFRTGLLSIEEDSSQSSSSLINEVVVEFLDPVSNNKRRARVQNIASIQSLGGIFSTTKQYPGIPTMEMAHRVAQRDLRAEGLPIKRFKVRMDRRAWKIAPYSVIRIRDDSRGISNMTLRVGQIEDNTADDGTFTLTCLQDIFGLPSTSFVTPQLGGYTPPPTDAVPPVTFLETELSYRDLYRAIGGTAAAAITTGEARVGVMTKSPGSLTLAIELFTKTSVETIYADRGQWPLTPTATLLGAISTGAQTVTLLGFTEWEKLTADTALLIDSEICRVNSWDATAGTVAISRGCADTIPLPHNSGARVWFYEGLFAVDSTAYMAGEIVNVKPCTKTNSSVLDVSLAPFSSATMNTRASRPYPPANVWVNTEGVPIRWDAIRTYTWHPLTKLSASYTGDLGGTYDTGPQATEAEAIEQLRLNYSAANPDHGWTIATGYPQTISGERRVKFQYTESTPYVCTQYQVLNDPTWFDSMEAAMGAVGAAIPPQCMGSPYSIYPASVTELNPAVYGQYRHTWKYCGSGELLGTNAPSWATANMRSGLWCSSIAVITSPEFVITQEGTGDFFPVTITWSHRNRLTQGDVLIPHEVGSITPEVGQTYTVQVYADDKTTVLRTDAGITGTEWTYTKDEWIADGEPDYFWVKLFSVRDGLNSLQYYFINVNAIPEYGLGWNLGWNLGGATP